MILELLIIMLFLIRKKNRSLIFINTKLKKMKKIYTIFALSAASIAFAQIQKVEPAFWWKGTCRSATKLPD